MKTQIIQKKTMITNISDIFIVSNTKMSEIVMAIVLLGFFLDYSGGIGIKYSVFLIAILFIMINKNIFDILLNRWSDFLVLIIIPLLISYLHILKNALFQYYQANLIQYSSRFYNTISAASLIILYPLFVKVGSRVILHQMSIGFRLVAMIMITLYALSYTNIINFQQYVEIVDRFRIGNLGLDPRLEDNFLGDSQRLIIAPYIAYPMIFILGYELSRSYISAILLFLSLILLGSRGILIGAVAIIITMLLFSNLRFSMISLLKFSLFLFILFLIIIIVEPVRHRLTEVLFNRTIQMVNVEDLSTLIRIGHFQGYIALIKKNFFQFFIGFGPMGEIFNPVLGDNVFITEISLLNIALYFGVPYASLYFIWFYHAAFKLWCICKDSGFIKEDIGLILGAIFFWLIGNTNPQMNAPFSIFAFMLINVRIIEVNQKAK